MNAATLADALDKVLFVGVQHAGGEAVEGPEKCREAARLLRQLDTLRRSDTLPLALEAMQSGAARLRGTRCEFSDKRAAADLACAATELKEILK